MSNFVTPIPVDVGDIARLLPRESFIEGVTWNAEKRQVEVAWSNRNLRTPFTTATLFTIQQLHDHDTPSGATIHAAPVEATPPPPAETKPRGRRKAS